MLFVRTQLELGTHPVHSFAHSHLFTDFSMAPPPSAATADFIDKMMLLMFEKPLPWLDDIRTYVTYVVVCRLATICHTLPYIV